MIKSILISLLALLTTAPSHAEDYDWSKVKAVYNKHREADLHVMYNELSGSLLTVPETARKSGYYPYYLAIRAIAGKDSITAAYLKSIAYGLLVEQEGKAKADRLIAVSDDYMQRATNAILASKDYQEEIIVPNGGIGRLRLNTPYTPYPWGMQSKSKSNTKGYELPDFFIPEKSPVAIKTPEQVSYEEAVAKLLNPEPAYPQTSPPGGYIEFNEAQLRQVLNIKELPSLK